MTLRRDVNGNWTDQRSFGTDRATGRRRRRMHTVDGSLTREEAQREMDEWFSSVTLPEALESWLASLGGIRSPKTLESYAGDCRRILRVLGSPRVADLDTRDVSVAISEMLRRGSASGGPLAPATVARARTVLLEVYDQLVDDGVCERNPVRGTKSPVVPAGGTVRAFDESELEEIRAALDAARAGGGRDRDMAEACLVVMLTGMRCGEACAVSWRDWRRAAGTIEVRRSVFEARSRGGVRVGIGPTKSRRSRRVAVPASLSEVLSERRARAGRPGPDEMVFPDPCGGLTRPSSVSRWFKALLGGIGVEGHLHMLRHSMATLMLESGASIKTVQSRLGHTDARTTLNYYTHALPGDDAAAAEGYDRLTGGMGGSAL